MAKTFERAKEENDMIKGCECKDKEYQQVRANDISKVSRITGTGQCRVRKSVQNKGAGNRTTKSGCKGCGKGARPARGKNCLTCRGSNHFAGIFRGRKAGQSSNHARTLEVGLKPKETGGNI